MTKLGFVRWSVATIATACLFNATPTWAQTQAEVDKLVPSVASSDDDPLESDLFGDDVDISGDVAIIGARQANDGSVDDTGAAYIFRLTETSPGNWEWIGEPKLTATDGALNDQFGTAVAIDGDFAVVGAPRDDNSSGSVYVFEYVSGSWSLPVKLTADDATSSDNFGTAVAIDGNVIVVGAYGDDDNGSASGSAYVFTHNGTDWTQTWKLTAGSAGDAFDQFGAAVAIDGSTIVVGSRNDDDMGSNSGAAYVFTDTGSGWPNATATKLTASDGSAGDQFGFSVSVSGDTMAVGAHSYDAFPQYDVVGSGRAYVYHNDGSTWTEKQVTAPVPVKSDQFGYSVAIQGDTLIVGALNNDDSFDDSGSAYVFTYDGTSWNQATKLNASDPHEFDQLGVFVAIDGNNVIAGARGVDDDGAAYIFDLSPPTDTTPPIFTPPLGTIEACYASVAAAEEAARLATAVIASDPESATLEFTAITFVQSCPSPDPSIVQITVTNEAGLSAAPVVYLTTIDAEAPAVSAPDDAIETTVIDPYAPLPPEVVGDGTSATATDCDPAPMITYEDLVIMATETEPTQVIRTWTATDACGNTASEDQVIAVPLADTDEDLITDSDEVTLYGTDPALADTDADGLDDGEEVEIAASNGGCPDPLVADADMDTLLDGDESALGTNPCNADTDGDGLTDDVDPFPTEPAVTTDVIADGIADLCELIAATDLDAFRGRRWMHRRIRQAILCWTLHKAEHALECNRPVLARRLLQIVLWRADGNSRPLRDWVIDPTAAAAIEADAELLIFLLDIEIGQ